MAKGIVSRSSKNMVGGHYNMPMPTVPVIDKKTKAKNRIKSQKTQLKSISGGAPPKEKQGSPDPQLQLKSVGGLRNGKK